MRDELSAPLGRKRRPLSALLPAAGKALPLARTGLVILALVAAGMVGWIIGVDDPTGGLPRAEAPVGTPAPNPLVDVVAQEGSQNLAPAEPQTVPGPISGPSIITLGEETPMSVAAEANLSQAEREILAFGAEPALVEETQFGLIPRVSQTGQRPFDAYARPSISPATAGGRGLVAVIVTGLGLNQTTTQSAVESLPGAVTLAFAPYGNNLVETARHAREQGHELMLEVPLEPFDYPQSDPGPHTLLVEQPPRDNLEKLYWLMARFGGYTGIINHMGARFTASAADFAPIMEELGLRGVGYLDDGSSNRSVASLLARENAVPFLRTDVVADTNPSRAAILAELERAEALARQRGHAVVTLSALPVSISTLAEWAQGLDTGATVLVPFSALAGRSGSED